MQAAAEAYSAVQFNMGQCCAAGSRTFVHEDVYDEVTPPHTLPYVFEAVCRKTAQLCHGHKGGSSRDSNAHPASNRTQRFDTSTFGMFEHSVLLFHAVCRDMTVMLAEGHKTGRDFNRERWFSPVEKIKSLLPHSFWDRRRRQYSRHMATTLEVGSDHKWRFSPVVLTKCSFVATQFVEETVKLAHSHKIGSGFDDDTESGPQVGPYSLNPKPTS